ncbi:MAG TPA: PEP-CTERM sorting domain-containing protein [Acidobacteriaceae bacterium]|nr:PEP-CTERM sorting domain-containing protein [Acidobacteriaceae bacterium]
MAGCGPACSYSIAPVPDWTAGTGQFQPGPTLNLAYFNYVPDGITVGYTNGPDLTQTVGVTVQNGVTYTMTVDIGHRTDATTYGGIAGLLVGNTFIPATGTDPGLGNWGTYTATFTGDSGNAGDTITVDLRFDGYQGDFDNVQLSDNVSSNVGPSVPEPSSISLLALGLGSLAGVVRRKFRS